MTSKQIALVLSHRHNLRQQLLVPNVSWGFVPWGESDLLCVSQAGYITEYEIKLTLADFKREWKKKRWWGLCGDPGKAGYYLRSFRQMVKFYYIVVPEKLATQVEPLIPEYIGAGLISVSPDWKKNYSMRWVEEKPAVANRKAERVSDAQRITLGRLAAMRYWSLAETMQC